jgi:hypothetical protein
MKIWESSEINEGKYARGYKVQVMEPNEDSLTGVSEIRYSTNGFQWTVIPVTVVKAIASAVCYFENEGCAK